MSYLYLFGEVLILVRGHASGHVIDDFGRGCGIVRCRLASAVISLKASHEPTVSLEVDLMHNITCIMTLLFSF